MQNFLFYFLILFIAKNVAGPNCYVSPLDEKLVPCYKRIKSNDTKQVMEKTYKCAIEAKPQLEDCDLEECFTMTGKYNGNTLMWYGCSKVMCKMHANRLVTMIFGREAQAGSCEYCSTDRCNANGHEENGGQEVEDKIKNGQDDDANKNNRGQKDRDKYKRGQDNKDKNKLIGQEGEDKNKRRQKDEAKNKRGQENEYKKEDDKTRKTKSSASWIFRILPKTAMTFFYIVLYFIL